ncbi:hypothetical protein [Geodermatophilus maliterrae]|uniref:DUF1622 domain-containing protein n=1 Tax=Geodermatophilus maliterrae TaxID=3162531 RepID=A0ABV3XID1_9ACTN
MTSLGPVPGLLALVVSALALVAGAVTLAATRRPALALGVLLDLLLAAGLLRLAAEPTWTSLATTAAVVLLRRLIGAGLRAGGRAFSAASVAPGPADRYGRRP